MEGVYLTVKDYRHWLAEELITFKRTPHNESKRIYYIEIAIKNLKRRQVFLLGAVNHNTEKRRWMNQNKTTQYIMLFNSAEAKRMLSSGDYPSSSLSVGIHKKQEN